MPRLVLLGPLEFWEERDGRLEFHTVYDANWHPRDSLLLDKGRIYEVLKDKRGHLYVVYDAGEEFDRLRAWSDDWPFEAKPVERLKVKVFMGSQCDEEFYPGEWIEDTACVPKYHESEATIPRKRYDRGSVYAKRPTPEELLQLGTVTVRNLGYILDWLLGRYNRSLVEEDGHFDGYVPHLKARSLYADLRSPLDAVVASESILYYSSRYGTVEAEGPGVVIVFHEKGYPVTVYKRTASFDEAVKLARRVAGAFNRGDRVEFTEGVPPAIEAYAYEATSEYTRRRLKAKLLGMLPRWAEGVVIVPLKRGGYAAYPVKKKRVYYARLTWRPLMVSDELAEFKHKLILKNGSELDVLWKAEKGLLLVYDPDEHYWVLPSKRSELRMLRYRMDEGVEPA